MDRSHLIEVTTLWFAAAITLQTTAANGDDRILAAAAMLALVLAYLLPVYVAVQSLIDYRDGRT